MNQTIIKDSYITEGKKFLGQIIHSISSISLNSSFVDIVEEILNCDGKIITTGMGKAGIAMKNFSAILCSMGMPSFYMHPGEALHGDIGLLSNNDVLIMASISGKTKEIIEVAELSKKINVKKIIGITSHKDSLLRKYSDVLFDMGEIDEAGHLNMVPTSSIIILIAITDAMAMVAAKEKNVDIEDYSRYHHAGYIGQKARKIISEKHSKND